MEDFTPEKQYRPEDEYESLEPQAPLTGAQYPTEPQAIPTAPAYQAPPRAAAYPTPPQQPYYAPYTQQPMQQPVQPVQPPVQQYPPAQNPAYPQSYPQQTIHPVYPQTPTVQQGQPVQNNQPYPPQAQPHLPLSPNPYAQSYNQPPAPLPAAQSQKPPTSTGTKVFIIILCALLLMMVVGFAVYIATGNNRGNSSQNSNGGYSDNGGNGNGGGYEIDPFNGIINNAANYTEVEDEITLKADNGDTLKRDDDNEASVGEPDEKAKNITLEPLPKDKDDDKYDTHSAYNAVSDSVVTVVCYQDKITDNDSDIVAQGTGTVISSDGYIITNAHVISNSRMYAVNIVFNNKEKYPAKIIGYDTWTDLAVLKIDAKDLKAVTFGDSSLINVGDDVIAVGSPGGEKFQNSLTKGVVSAVDRELTINKYVRYIQSDAAISPGNSGGPLCNIYGQVIGITTVKTVANYYENMSFSIPSVTVEEIVGDLMRYGYVKGRCRIGITGTENGSDSLSYSNVPAGVTINAIDENGPLAGTKIKAGDIITELDGETITSFQDIYDVLADHKEGDKISIKVQRPSN